MKEMYADLIAAAKEAYQNAYVPYSKFPVGAALKLKDGNIKCSVESIEGKEV